MRKKIMGATIACALTAVFSGGSAIAAGPVIVAVAGANTAGYSTPVMAAQRSGELTFASADIVIHNVVVEECIDPPSTDPRPCYGPDSQPWCIFYPVGECPLIWSDYVSVGTTPVLGLENAVPGQTYVFYCAPHATTMRGRLVILPSP